MTRRDLKQRYIEVFDGVSEPFLLVTPLGNIVYRDYRDRDNALCLIKKGLRTTSWHYKLRKLLRMVK